MLRNKILLKTLLVVMWSACVVVAIFDPNYTEKTKSYRLDPYIARELQRTQHHQQQQQGIPSFRSQSNPRLSTSARYQTSSSSGDNSGIEQHERHAIGDHTDYANNLDDYYGGCPSGYTGLLPYPYDCRRFVNCWKGRAYIQTCGPGTVFNGDTLECDNPNKVVCKGLNAKSFEQQPTNNRVGRLQQQNQGGLSEVSCPSGYTGLLPHPNDCSKFLNCAGGSMHIQTCGPQTMFNPRMKVCDFATKVDCTGRGPGGDGSLVSSSPSQSPASWSGNRGGKNFEITTTQNQPTEPQRKGWQHNHNHNHNHHHHMHGFHPDYPSGPTRGGSFMHHNHNCTDRSHHHNHNPQNSPPQQPTVQAPIFNRNRWTSMNRTRPSVPTTRKSIPSWTPMPNRETSGWRPIPQVPIPTKPTWSSRGSSGSPVETNPPSEQNSLSPNYAPPPPIQSPVHHPPSKYHERERHNRHFHEMHPNMPNPFGNELGAGTDDSSEIVASTTPMNIETSPEAIVNPKESDLCEFDCGNGQCVKSFETCDGINNCENRKDEEQCAHLGYEIRLSNQGHGRVEVKILGQWGYVCDDKFGIQDANVVCRELGFPLGASEVHGNSYYPPADGGEVAFIMDEVDCVGNETSLKECRFKGWGISDCGPDEVVGVQCKTPVMTCPNDYWLCSTSKECIPPAFVCDNVPDCTDKSDESTAICNSTVEFRLRGGTIKHEGRLEVLYRGVWGTVCDDDFGQTEAQVACNSLGYYGPAKIVKNAFGPGTGPIWLDQLSCFGNETTLDTCNHWSWGEHNCNHTEDVSLKCTPGSAPRPTNTKPKNPSHSEEDLQTDDIGMDLYPVERSSKAANPARRICGHFNANLTDELPLELERVVRGNVAKRGHHPWQATIRTKGRGGISSHWCGAVLISKKHLLTAAHCLVGYPKGAYFIRLGDHYANIAESSEIDSYIENWYIHEKFRDGTHMNNDIALIVMKNPVRFNDYIQPICLPPEGTEYKEGRRCTISGWGSIQSGVSTPSNNLRVAEIPVLSDEICKLPHVYGKSVTDGMFCAGFLEEGVDACEGDSGGPFVCSDSDAETLYGIISWGQQCGHANKPGVYVKVEKYLNWIYEKIRFSMQQSD